METVTTAEILQQKENWRRYWQGRGLKILEVAAVVIQSKVFDKLTIHLVINGFTKNMFRIAVVAAASV